MNNKRKKERKKGSMKETCRYPNSFLTFQVYRLKMLGCSSFNDVPKNKKIERKKNYYTVVTRGFFSSFWHDSNQNKTPLRRR